MHGSDVHDFFVAPIGNRSKGMAYAVYVEWVDEEKARRLYTGRRNEAVRKAREIDPTRRASDVVSPEDSVWDWVETDEAVETRKFPSVAMAKGWAEKHHARDVFGTPRVYQNEWPDAGFERDAETVVQLEYQDGRWLDLASGEVLPERSGSTIG